MSWTASNELVGTRRGGRNHDLLGVVQDAAAGVTQAPGQFVTVDRVFVAVGGRSRRRIRLRRGFGRRDGSHAGWHKRRGHNRRTGDAPQGDRRHRVAARQHLDNLSARRDEA
jgi:hypothetical protein